MTELPPNPYTATSESVETRSTTRRTVNGNLVATVVETISVTSTGSRDVTKEEARFTTTDGRTIDDKTIVVICDTCHGVISKDASRTCAVCQRVVCGRCIHRVIREAQRKEVCKSCRWRTLLTELSRLS